MAEPASARALAALRRFGPLALLAAGLAVALALGLPRELSLHQLHRHGEQLRAFTEAHPVLSVATYLVVYAMAVGFSLPVALVLTLTGGYLFGPWIGGLAAAIGCTLGGSAVFLVCRTAAGDVLRRRAGPTIARIEDEVLRDAFSYILVLRLVPVMPLWLSNIALGFIEIPLRTFALATFLGILPVSFVYAGLGSGLGRMFQRGERPDLHAVLRPEVLGALIGLAVLSLVPIVLRRLRRPAP
jgi:uncharacterized membrane protein YdjX (TVP38/TMEM64 family)